MPQDENPYASPLARQVPLAADNAWRFQSNSFLFLVTDLTASTAVTVSALYIYLRDTPILAVWAIGAVLLFLPAAIGLIAFVLLVRGSNTALPVAYTVGGYGIVIGIAALAYLGLAMAGYAASFVLCRILWNIGYIIAARTFFVQKKCRQMRAKSDLR